MREMLRKVTLASRRVAVMAAPKLRKSFLPML